jgi:hypothetical protein
MKFITVKTYEELSKMAADIIAAQIIIKPDCVLGLATGSTPVGTYQKLAEKNKEIEKLKTEFEELRYIVDEFREWFNENGCPKYFDPDFPCSAETEYKNDPETEGDFDERDCWKNEADHGCWVEYYRWKYRQKVGKDTNVPTNAPDTGKMEG